MDEDIRKELQELARSQSGETLDLSEIAHLSDGSVEELAAVLEKAGVSPMTPDGIVYDRFDILTGLSRREPAPPPQEDEREREVVLRLEDVEVGHHRCESCGTTFWFELHGNVTCPECGVGVEPISSGARLVAWNQEELRFEEGEFDG